MNISISRTDDKAIVSIITIDEKEQKELGAEYCGKVQECAIRAFEEFAAIHPQFTYMTFYAPTEEEVEENNATD